MNGTSEQLHRIGGWARRVSAELGTVVRLPMASAL